MDERLKALEKEMINKRIENEENTELIEIMYMLYDTI
jgi:hypothetical protein